MHRVIWKLPASQIALTVAGIVSEGIQQIFFPEALRCLQTLLYCCGRRGFEEIVCVQHPFAYGQCLSMCVFIPILFSRCAASALILDCNYYSFAS
jgi:hypothetical protein